VVNKFIEISKLRNETSEEAINPLKSMLPDMVQLFSDNDPHYSSAEFSVSQRDGLHDTLPRVLM